MSLEPLVRRATRHPAALVAFGYLAIRLTDLVGFLVLGGADDRPFPASLTAWDGDWYARAAREGWPEALDAPTGDAPAGQTTWAWPPAYPLLARLLVLGDGRVRIALLAIALVSGLLAALVLARLLRPHVGAAAGVGVALLWASMPASPTLVMAYSEGLFCLLALSAVWAAARDRYVLAGTVLLAAGTVRSASAVFAAAVAIAAWVAWRRGSTTGPRALATIVLSAASVAAWPLAVAIRFGDPAAFGRVQAAWGRSSVPFLDTVAWSLHLDLQGWPEVAFTVLALVVAAVAALGVWREHRLPLVVRLVGPLSVAALAATGVGISGVRLMLPDIAIPTWLQPLVRTTTLVVVVALGLLALRWAWIGVYVGGPSGGPPP